MLNAARGTDSALTTPLLADPTVFRDLKVVNEYLNSLRSICGVSGRN